MLKISDNGRFLVHKDGKPFFYLGDTAWELFNFGPAGVACIEDTYRSKHGTY